MSLEDLKPRVAPDDHGTVFHGWWERLPAGHKLAIFVLGLGMIAAAVWRYATHPQDHAHTEIGRAHV